MKWLCPHCDVVCLNCPGEGKQTHDDEVTLKCPKCEWFLTVKAEGAVLGWDEQTLSTGFCRICDEPVSKDNGRWKHSGDYSVNGISYHMKPSIGIAHKPFPVPYGCIPAVNEELA